MILDKNALWADNLAFGGTPSVIDLGSHGISSGPGEPFDCFIQSTASLTGCTGVQILSHETTTPPTDVAMEINATVAELANGVEFRLPSNIKRYVTVALIGTVSAGSYSAGVIIKPMGTAQ